MRKTILLLLLLSNMIHFTQAQFLRRVGNQVNNALSGNNNSDSSGHLKHHGKGSLVGNIGNSIRKGGNISDSSLKLTKEDEAKPTHADLSKFNTQHYYKLQEGEKFSFYEACLLMQADKLNPRILVVKDGKPWLIGNDGQHIAVDPKKIEACPLNTRGGDVVPFDNLNGDQSEAYGNKPAVFYVKSPGGEDILNDMGIDTAVLAKMQRSMDQGDTAAALRQAIGMNKRGKPVTPDFKPRTTIVFRGKTFGPYIQVKSYVFNRGAGKFLAIVDFRRPNTDITTIKGDFNKLMEPWLVGSDGARVKLPDGATKIIADEDLSFVRVHVLKNSPSDIRDVHASLFDPKTGKSIPIFNNEGLARSTETEQSIEMKSGNLITKQHSGQQTKLYINDKWMTTLEGESDIPLTSVFVSKDASRWAIWGSKALYFSNGETVDGVISVRVRDSNSLSSLNWIVLGNDNKTLELCNYEL